MYFILIIVHVVNGVFWFKKVEVWFVHCIQRFTYFEQETHVMRLDISVGIVISSLYKHTEYDVIIIFHINILQND